MMTFPASLLTWVTGDQSLHLPTMDEDHSGQTGKRVIQPFGLLSLALLIF